MEKELNLTADECIGKTVEDWKELVGRRITVPTYSIGKPIYVGKKKETTVNGVVKTAYYTYSHEKDQFGNIEFDSYSVILRDGNYVFCFAFNGCYDGWRLESVFSAISF